MTHRRDERLYAPIALVATHLGFLVWGVVEGFSVHRRGLCASTVCTTSVEFSWIWYVPVIVFVGLLPACKAISMLRKDAPSEVAGDGTTSQVTVFTDVDPEVARRVWLSMFGAIGWFFARNQYLSWVVLIATLVFVVVVVTAFTSRRSHSLFENVLPAVRVHSEATVTTIIGVGLMVSGATAVYLEARHRSAVTVLAEQLGLTSYGLDPGQVVKPGIDVVFLVVGLVACVVPALAAVCAQLLGKRAIVARGVRLGVTAVLLAMAVTARILYS